MAGPLSQLFQTPEDDSVAQGSSDAQHLALDADPSIDIAVDLTLETGGTYTVGDETTTWSNELDVGLDLSTSAVVSAVLDNGSSDYRSEV